MRLIGKKRLQFAREHKDWTLEQWKKVMWSDESRFTLFQSDVWLVRSKFSNIMCPKNEVSWLYWMTRLFHQWIFSSLVAQAYSKMTMLGFIGLKLWKSGSGSMRHHVDAWIVHQRVQTLTPLRIFGTWWRRLCTVVWLSHHQYKILVKN